MSDIDEKHQAAKSHCGLENSGKTPLPDEGQGSFSGLKLGRSTQ